MGRLHSRGPWKRVEWRTLTEQEAELYPTAAPHKEHCLFLTGTFNDWRSDEPMHPDPNDPAKFVGEIQLISGDVEFQIVRDGDWSQVIYPARPLCAGESSTRILGPDDNGKGLHWCLNGCIGDIFR